MNFKFGIKVKTKFCIKTLYCLKLSWIIKAIHALKRNKTIGSGIFFVFISRQETLKNRDFFFLYADIISHLVSCSRIISAFNSLSRISDLSWMTIRFSTIAKSSRTKNFFAVYLISCFRTITFIVCHSIYDFSQITIQ